MWKVGLGSSMHNIIGVNGSISMDVCILKGQHTLDFHAMF